MVLVFVCGKGYNRQEVTGPVWTKGNGRGKGRRGEGEQRAAITGVGSMANGVEKTGRFCFLIIP